MDDFGGYNITLNVEDESLSEIAKLASEEKTGAPRLLTILEKVLHDFKFELQSTDIKQFQIPKDDISNTKGAIDKLLKNVAKAR